MGEVAMSSQPWLLPPRYESAPLRECDEPPCLRCFGMCTELQTERGGKTEAFDDSLTQQPSVEGTSAR